MSSTAVFADLSLSKPVLAAIDAVGYEAPTPIQAATIPPMLEGRDVLGQAQTGTGKTAAFALPILSKIALDERRPQALVLTPTRELAIQVAEAFKKYAAKLPSFHVLPIYGGQAYNVQLGALKRGVHVVVGTPGRLIDHIERGTLDLSRLTTLVLDEADEMLRMGFIDDVERILQKTPDTRQTALFSATMPPQIRRIARDYLKTPAEITIRAATTTAKNIRQRYWLVSGTNKLDALTRILEGETFEGMLVFVRTKAATVELAERLGARGFEASPLNGDMDQRARERVVARLKSGALDIVIATDVAARGLDVERIGHVINYDIPTDAESYIHRVGRTGRAGRSGEAILFVAPRERHLLRAIERATRQPVEPMALPSVTAVNDQRVDRFRRRIDEALALSDLPTFRVLVEDFERERNVPAIEIAAALARLEHGNMPFFLDAPEPPPPPPERRDGRHDDDRRPPERSRESLDADMDAYRLEVGAAHGARPAAIVGAIINELKMRREFIGKIIIEDDHSLVHLPTGMPEHVLRKLGKIRIVGRELRASIVDGSRPARPRPQRPGPQRPGPERPGPPRRDKPPKKKVSRRTTLQ